MANIPKNPRSNCYFECKEGGPLHHFPKPDRDMERFDAWKAVLYNNTKEKGNIYIYNQLRLCNKHFEHYYKSPSNCLTRNAIPTLYTRKDIGSSSSTEICIKSAPAVLIVQKDMSIGSTVDEDAFTSAELNSGSLPGPSDPKDIKNTLVRKSKKGLTKQSNHLKVIERLNQRILKLTIKCKTQTKQIQLVKKKYRKLNRLFKSLKKCQIH